jgi:FMN-dependent NADH-azoreductase
LRDVLALIGLTDVQFIYLEGVNMGEVATAQAWQVARQAMLRLVPKKVA